ncbi:Hypothetical protein RMP42_05843 [Roseomonas mucosa]|nr:Hypothetical protein RMP42_05843 [Roseomonas mucosa]
MGRTVRMSPGFRWGIQKRSESGTGMSCCRGNAAGWENHSATLFPQSMRNGVEAIGTAALRFHIQAR